MYKSPQQLRSSLPVAAEAVLARVLCACACYLIPIGIGLVSLLALMVWHNQYSFSDNLMLDIRVLPEDAQTSTPLSALSRLQEQAPVRGFDTHLDETPFWFSFDTVHRVGGPEVIEFPSRHAFDIACWDTAGMTLLGAATTNSGNALPFQTLTAAKAGFALRLTFMPSRLLCRARFSGPGHISVAQWPADQFALSIDQYHRKSGLLDGGMIVLALFVLIMAAVHRQLLYVVFAGWLILNLRIGSMLAGWDVQWLGQMVPPPWLMGGRAATVVLYGITTLTLYQMLLGDYLVGPRQRLAVRIVQWLCLPMLVAGFALPFQIFTPILWAITSICICLLTADLVRILFAARSLVALYFTAGLVVAFASGLSEIIVGALDLRALEGMIDSVTAALASSLLAALAVAEQIRIEMEQRLAAQAELGNTWEALPAALFTLDGAGRFLACNPALRTMLGNAAIAPRHTTWADFFGPAAWLRLNELVHTQERAAMDIGQVFELESDCGSRFMVRATLSRGRIDGILENITGQVQETAQLRYMAHHDAMTGVLNRLGIEHMFASGASALAAGRPLALAFLDLDRFKLINDLYGHAAGDEVLKQVCERVMSMLAAGQYMGRIGGDTFLLLMPDAPVPAVTLACRAIVERIAGTPYLVGDKAVTIRASLGLINVMQGMHMADAIASAERACREAKSTTGAGLGHASAAEARLVARLSSPNATEGLFLDMKPIVSVAAPGGSLNVDVLLRMRAPDGSIVVAAPIIAAAEKSGRAGVIDRWVLGTALEWIERHASTLANMQFVSIKVSGAALNDEHFVQDLLALLQRHGSAAGRLCVAISERVALQDLDNTRRFMDLVRAYGVKVALDEFGALHTSFSYLKQLQADFLKIDAAFSADLHAHPANAAIVEAIVHLAKKLGMKTIAPGVHDTATVRALAGIGVDYVQGEGVARPQSLDAILVAQSSASFVDATRLPELAVSAAALQGVHEPVHPAV